MKKEFKPIAMRCNNKEFSEIKEKLVNNKITISNLHKFSPNTYLVNNFGGNESSITNVNQNDAGCYNREIHEEWNEKIFLEACGIVVEEPKEESFVITKEQINSILGTNNILTVHYSMREWFSSVFEDKKELVVGKWYKSDLGNLINYQSHENLSCYGFGYVNKNWLDNITFNDIEHEFTEATDQEVKEALEKEAVKRYKFGDYCKSASHSKIANFTYQGNLELESNMQRMHSNGWAVFYKGQWAELTTKQMTQSDIEKELGYKIEIV